MQDARVVAGALLMRIVALLWGSCGQVRSCMEWPQTGETGLRRLDVDQHRSGLWRPGFK